MMKSGNGAKNPLVKKGIQSINIPAIETRVVELTLVGSTSLYVHQFAAKVQQQIADDQAGVAKKKKAPKVPFDEFLGALYIINQAKVPKKKLSEGESWPYVPNTFGIKAGAFKGSIVNACSFLDGITKRVVSGAIHVLGNIVPLTYSRVEMVKDPVRVGPFKVADMRYRPLFHDWKVTLSVRFNCRIFTLEQIANLFENAGFHVGVGDWRPEKGGTWGTFSVERE